MVDSVIICVDDGRSSCFDVVLVVAVVVREVVVAVGRSTSCHEVYRLRLPAKNNGRDSGNNSRYQLLT